MKVLWTAGHGEPWEEFFTGKFDDIEITKEGLALHPELGLSAVVRDEEKVKELVADKDILVLGSEYITAEVLANAPNLKLILSERDGPEENIDIKTCSEMGIPVISAGGRCAKAVAELNLALMMALARRVLFYDEALRHRGWPSRKDKKYDKFTNMFELNGKTLSIIGFGRNGKALAKIVSGLEMNILAYDPYVTEEVCQEYGVTSVSLEEALSQGDFVSILARVTPETTGMIGAEQIALMKPTAFLINCGRAQLTDENAIYEAVKNEKIQGIGMDVYMKEGEGVIPPYADLPLDRCIITPHIAGFGDKRVYYSYTYMLDGLKCFLKGEKPSRCYNPKVYDSPEFAERGGTLFGIE